MMYRKKKIMRICQWCGNRISINIDDIERNAKAQERQRIIDLIREHQTECDSLGIIATAEWVKEVLKNDGSN